MQIGIKKSIFKLFSKFDTGMQNEMQQASKFQKQSLHVSKHEAN